MGPHSTDLPSSGKVVLTIPNKPGLIEALGRLAMAHTHLEVILKYTFKTLSGLSVQEALAQMSKNRTSFVRKRIRRLFLEKQPTREEIDQLELVLERAKALSAKRNELFHAAWSESPAGEPLMKAEGTSWGPAPTQAEVECLATALVELSEQLNYERLHGFIRQVAQRELPARVETSGCWCGPIIRPRPV